jgi:hypothetical protein
MQKKTINDIAQTEEEGYRRRLEAMKDSVEVAQVDWHVSFFPHD